jgi:putative PIN family toxin of toxin-antitoxin system
VPGDASREVERETGRPLKVVVDTNVLISAACNPEGLPSQVLSLCEARGWDIVICDEILFEFARNLRKAFKGVSTAQIQALNDEFQRSFTVLQVSGAVDARIPDPKDSMLFECAALSGADYIVTGDKKLWTVKIPGTKLKVVNPRFFLGSFT